ncbi:ATP synthase F1 subunit delta, partial [Methanocalculus natronophilus]|uniref:ATP synthase F1 subunit delta n=1 Tax=Methanocalculus natronophilus TaxID=1262400 RepID=UPI0031B587B4
MSAISDQYAIALFEVSKEEDNLDAISNAYESFLEAIDKESMDFFLHPGIDKATKIEIIQKTDGPKTLKNFLSVLIQNNRFNGLKEIKESFDDLLDSMHNRMDVVVYSQKKLTKKRLETLKLRWVWIIFLIGLILRYLEWEYVFNISHYVINTLIFIPAIVGLLPDKLLED